MEVGATPDPARATDPVSSGVGSRVAIGSRVALSILFASAAVLMLVWLAERPGLRLRADLSAGRENTLEPASSAVLEKLQAEADVDVFLRPAEAPFQQIGDQVQERLRRLLRVFRDVSGGRVRVREHDVLSREGIAASQVRLRELGVREVSPGGLVVVSAGTRQAVLALRGDLCDLDPGDPRPSGGPPRPPRLVAFRGEEALVSALLRVSQGDAPRILFSSGHGEREIGSTDAVGGLSDLVRTLEGDGFRVGRWEGEKDGDIPESCGVLAIVGPEQPFTAAEYERILAFQESGGRVICAPGFSDAEGATTLAALTARTGIRLNLRGMIARPVVSASRQLVTGIPQCAEVIVWSDGMQATNPVTEPLRRADRRVHLPFVRSLDRGEPPPGGTVLNLLRSGDEAWRDLPDAPTPTRYDWTPSQAEARGPFVLAMQALFSPTRPVPKERAGAVGARPESRLLCLGSADAFTNEYSDANRDFLLASFNWAAARDFRVNLAPKNPASRRMDVGSGDALAMVNLETAIVLPGLCLLLGAFTAWKRKRR